MSRGPEGEVEVILDGEAVMADEGKETERNDFYVTTENDPQ